MKERAVRIGKPTPLVGIITEPDVFDAGKPAIVMLNSGVMHHIGSCRMSVKLARELAKAGFMSVRFDFSGIGDSEPRRGGDAFHEVAPKETTEVMDYLQRKRGVNRFVLFGLCSGADGAYDTALVDERVVGMAQVDPYAYRTWKYYVHYYAPKLLEMSRWTGFVKRKLGLASTVDENEAAPGVDAEFIEIPTYTRVFPDRAVVARGLSALMARDLRALSMCTGGEEAYNYSGQYADSFRDVEFKGRLAVEFYPESSHIITEPAYQVKAVGRIVSWALEEFSDDSRQQAA